MSVIHYPYNDKTQLSEHFNVQEFRCKCGKSHDILIATELVSQLERLYTTLNCSKIIITSGHRCVEHDKSLGNSGVGQHILGKAADCCCYDQSNKPISSKIVCCVAQDLGFGGIANITNAYIYTHLDVRTSNFYKGNEVINYRTLTSDFYQYYGISRNETPTGNTNVTSQTKKEEQVSDMSITYKGIDISKHQGNVDFSKLKGNVDFVIIRAGYGKLASQKDAKFEEYYAGCKKYGIPVGAYWYSYATTVAEAQQEAQVFLNVIKGKQFDYPVYFDLEERNAFNTGKSNCSAMVRAFCGKLEEAGYYAGLYMSRSPFTTYMESDIKDKYTLWLAEYNSKLNYTGTVGMWQYGEKGSVAGVSGHVDVDYSYKDFSSIIKNVGLNGYPKQSNPAPVEPIISEAEKVVEELLDAPEIAPIEGIAPLDKKQIKVVMEFDDHKYSGLLEEM